MTERMLSICDTFSDIDWSLGIVALIFALSFRLGIVLMISDFFGSSQRVSHMGENLGFTADLEVTK